MFPISPEDLESIQSYNTDAEFLQAFLIIFGNLRMPRTFLQKIYKHTKFDTLG